MHLQRMACHRSIVERHGSISEGLTLLVPFAEDQYNVAWFGEANGFEDGGLPVENDEQRRPQ